MQNPERWQPSKYVQRGGRLRATRNRAELGVASRLVADLVAERYARHLPRFARGRLADLGCGKVPLYATYRGLVDSVTCVDWPQSVHGTSHLDVEADLGAVLPLADAAFDTLLLSDVLEHVPQPDLLWHEMARLLAPGGHLLLNLPFLYGLHEVPHDYARYTEFALRRFAKGAGLELVLLETVGGSLHVLADLLAKHVVRLPLLGVPLALGLQGTVRALDATGFGRRLAEHSAQRFPLGYFMVLRRAVATANA
jgi:SAM-dependent methyltransferase